MKKLFCQPLNSWCSDSQRSSSGSEAAWEISLTGKNRRHGLRFCALTTLLVAAQARPSVAAPAAPTTPLPKAASGLKKTPSVGVARTGSQDSRGESYILGSGDGLRVMVSGYPEFNQESVVIPPDGTVTLPDFGTLRLSGKTRLGVQRELSTLLRRRTGLRNPIVAVSITQFRSSVIGSVILSGDVPRSGNFDIREGQRLSDLLAVAGLQSRLEERRATLIRRGSGIIALNLKAAAATPRGAFDIALRPGDSITVTQLKAGQITLQGDLPKRGIYEMHLMPMGKEAMEVGLHPRLSDLIIQAGGLRTESAPVLVSMGAETGAVNPNSLSAPLNASKPATYRGVLQRRGKRIDLNPTAALDEIGGPANIRLQPGDIVKIESVPAPAPLTVYLDGLSDGSSDGSSAARTGSFQVPQGTGVLELLTTAGGLTKAPRDIIASVRRGAKVLPLDLSALLLSSESGANLELKNGDIVQLRELATIEIRVAGQVAKPGPLHLKPGATILEALLAAGGLSLPAEQVRLNVLRKESDGTQRILPANAVGIIGLQDVSTNFALQNGDLVNIAQNATQTVFISGAVNSPGSVQLRGEEGLPELITRAGGAKPDAALTRVNVTRGGQVIQVDAYDAVKDGKPLVFAIQDGDFVVIPQNKSQVLVMEAVAKPGYYPIPERGHLTLLDVLAQATPLQNTKTVSITRAKADGTVDMTIVPREIKLDALRQGKTENIVLSPRDIVFVPSPKTKTSLLGTLTGTLTSVGALRFLFPF